MIVCDVRMTPLRGVSVYILVTITCDMAGQLDDLKTL